MKRFLAFLSVLLAVLIVGYLEPVFFPPEKAEIDLDYGSHMVSHTALPHEEILASGYALYIGKKVSDFTQEFGEPLTRYPSGMGYDMLTFGEEDSEYMEVSVKDETIQAVKVFNTTQATAPFELGMTLTDISELTTIFSNFTIEYNAEDVSFELMEEDMNYRPLIAFDNQSFAVLFFTHGKDVLSGITYLSKEYLLTVMPYQMINGQGLSILAEQQEEEAVTGKQKTLTRMINLLRIKEDLPPYRIEPGAEKNAASVYQVFEEHQVDIMSVERLETLSQIRSESLGEIGSAFAFTPVEFAAMVDQSDLSIRKPNGLFMTPIYDPSFAALFWFSDGAYYARFSRDEEQNIGVAFSQADVLVLLQNVDNNTDETEGSR